MIVQVIEGLCLGSVLSVLCFFRPFYLSKNIIPLNSGEIKWGLAVLSTFLCTIWVLYKNPAGYSEWLLIFFEQIFLFTAVTDTYSKIIPNRFLFGMLVCGMLMVFIQSDWANIVVILVVFGTGIILQFISQKIWRKTVFGWGDIKLFSVLSLVTGWNIELVIYISLVLGGLLSIIGIASKKISKNSKIPLSVFILLAYLIVEYTLKIAFFIPK